MGTRTMGSHGGGGSGNGEIQHPKSDGLSKQGLLYNLTLDEVQHQLGDLGKPLSSMNLDELLKSVWTAEAEANQNPGPIDFSQHAQLASTSSMARQSSLTDLSKKTVDELWQDIQKKKDTNTTHTSGSNDNNGGSGYNPEKKNIHEKQPTLGEMTLEDFLAKAGIVAESSQEKKNMPSVVGHDSIALPQQNVSPQQAPWIQYQIPPIQQAQHVFVPGHHQVQQPLPTATMEGGYLETQMTMSPLVGTVSETQTPGRKRVASGDVMEKTVERRQKRMIKNRESAARSRARKQAYTHELENKVSRLEEENERLKREQEAENILPSVPPPEPRYQLRRTSSAPVLTLSMPTSI